MASSPFNSSRFVAIQHRGARGVRLCGGGNGHGARRLDRHRRAGAGERDLPATAKTFTEVFRFRGIFRDATATGGMNSTDLATSQFADIFNASSADVFVCHGC